MTKTWKVIVTNDYRDEMDFEQIVSAESKDEAYEYAMKEACDRWIDIDVTPASEDAQIQDIAELAAKSVGEMVRLAGKNGGSYDASNFSAALHNWMTEYFSSGE